MWCCNASRHKRVWKWSRLLKHQGFLVFRSDEREQLRALAPVCAFPGDTKCRRPILAELFPELPSHSRGSINSLDVPSRLVLQALPLPGLPLLPCLLEELLSALLLALPSQVDVSATLEAELEALHRPEAGSVATARPRQSGGDSPLCASKQVEND